MHLWCELVPYHCRPPMPHCCDHCRVCSQLAFVFVIRVPSHSKLYSPDTRSQLFPNGKKFFVRNVRNAQKGLLPIGVLSKCNGYSTSGAALILFLARTTQTIHQRAIGAFVWTHRWKLFRADTPNMRVIRVRIANARGAPRHTARWPIAIAAGVRWMQMRPKQSTEPLSIRHSP